MPFVAALRSLALEAARCAVVRAAHKRGASL